MVTHKTSNRRRDPYTRTVVRLPERELSESVLCLAAPLIKSLGPTPLPDDIRRMVEIVIDLWNARLRSTSNLSTDEGGGI
ncbi:MAG: hypothetical protein JXA30_05855 [Deltaproteobacteria bacterium]|nr:hypothetical protein [Deltaproteobacteria bacterium]